MSEERLERIEGALAAQGEQLAALREQVVGVKETLARLEPLLIKVLEIQAEMRGEVRGQLDQMSHRISDVNSRLPVAMGYTPPGEGRKLA